MRETHGAVQQDTGEMRRSMAPRSPDATTDRHAQATDAVSAARSTVILGTERPVGEAARATAGDSAEVRAVRVGRWQHGHVTRRQLRELGVAARTTQRRITDGVWAAHAGGVIDLGTHANSWEQEVTIALLAAGADHRRAWASHLTAGRLHRLLDVDPPQQLEVIVRLPDRPRSGQTKVHRVRALAPDEVTVVDGFPVTSVARTLLDLAAILPTDRMEPLLWDACRRAPDSAVQLARLVERSPHHRGRSAASGLLQGLHPQIAEAASPLEVYGLLALRDPSLPRPQLQYRVRDHHGRIIKRVDAAWPEARIAIEFDGVAYHGSAGQRARDRLQRERLRAIGWVVLEVTAADLSGPRLATVKDDLRRRLHHARSA